MNLESKGSQNGLATARVHDYFSKNAIRKIRTSHRLGNAFVNHVSDEGFVWKMCVFYHSNNAIIRKYPNFRGKKIQIDI